MLTQRGPTRTVMSKAEFLQRATVREECWQDWEEGEGIQLTPAHGRHGEFMAELYVRIKHWLNTEALGIAKPDLFVDFPGRIYGVDIVVLLGKNVERYRDGRVVGPPDLVVEILSPDSIERDRVTKFDFFCDQQVPWYWIGDPVALTLEEYQFVAGRYSRTASGSLATPFKPQAFPGLSLSLADLQETGPS